MTLRRTYSGQLNTTTRQSLVFVLCVIFVFRWLIFCLLEISVIICCYCYCFYLFVFFFIVIVVVGFVCCVVCRTASRQTTNIFLMNRIVHWPGIHLLSPILYVYILSRFFFKKTLILIIISMWLTAIETFRNRK